MSSTDSTNSTKQRTVTVAAIQMYCNRSREENIKAAEKKVREAAGKGAQIILLPELFETWYFCQERNYDSYGLATPVDGNPAVLHFQKVAKELQVVLPVSFFERAGNVTYNSVAVIDADGQVLGVYRKTHIPDDHFYQEKFYFTPGDTGFRVWNTAYAKIGVGICWDQWFPESARCMALKGAELLFYPTAIGSEPIIECDSMPHWRRCMQGHAAANVMPLIVANRIGEEKVVPSKENNEQSSSLTFYGASFITDETGEVVEDAGRYAGGSCPADNSHDAGAEKVLLHTFNLDEIEKLRFSWGLFRDRRPEAYSEITW